MPPKEDKKSGRAYWFGRFGSFLGRGLTFVGEYAVPLIIMVAVIVVVLSIASSAGGSIPVIAAGVGALVTASPATVAILTSALTIAVGLIFNKFSKTIFDGVTEKYKNIIKNFFRPKTEITNEKLMTKLNANITSIQEAQKKFKEIETKVISFIAEAKKIAAMRNKEKREEKLVELKKNSGELIKEIDSNNMLISKHKNRFKEAINQITKNPHPETIHTFSRGISKGNTELQLIMRDILEITKTANSIHDGLQNESNEHIGKIYTFYDDVTEVTKRIDKCDIIAPEYKAELITMVNNLKKYASQDNYAQEKEEKHAAKNEQERAASYFKRQLKMFAAWTGYDNKHKTEPVEQRQSTGHIVSRREEVAVAENPKPPASTTYIRQKVNMAKSMMMFGNKAREESVKATHAKSAPKKSKNRNGSGS